MTFHVYFVCPLLGRVPWSACGASGHCCQLLGRRERARLGEHTTIAALRQPARWPNKRSITPSMNGWDFGVCRCCNQFQAPLCPPPALTHEILLGSAASRARGGKIQSIHVWPEAESRWGLDGSVNVPKQRCETDQGRVGRMLLGGTGGRQRQSIRLRLNAVWTLRSLLHTTADRTDCGVCNA